MKLEWTKSAKSEKDKQEIQEILKRSTIPFGLLRDIINQRLQTLDRDECTIKDFEDPNWAYKQAFRNGVRATHQYYLDLINFEDHKKENNK